MKPILPCPFCGRSRLEIRDLDVNEFYVLCDSCGSTGPVVLSAESAVMLWDKRFNCSVLVPLHGKN